jgi:hypothetical protein
LGLTADEFGRAWTDAHGAIVLRTESWGSRTGQGDNEKVDTGRRLIGRTAKIMSLLAEEDCALAILVSLARTLKLSDSDYQRESAGVILLLESNGSITLIPTRGEIPKADDPLEA